MTHLWLPRSDHFQEFFRSAKGTETAVNDDRPNGASVAAADAAGAAWPSAESAAPAILDPAPPQPSATSPADPTPLPQDSVPQTTSASSADHDPQTCRQQQHEQAEAGRQADLQVRFADVGCGFGGLLVRLSPLYPHQLMVGMEIRDKVRHAPLPDPDWWPASKGREKARKGKEKGCLEGKELKGKAKKGDKSGAAA